jgi:hypothetical protein
MNSANANLIPLQFASLCLDCEMITQANGRCLACGSGALLSVARTLSRPGAIQFPRRDSTAVAHMAARRVAHGGDFAQST